MAAQPDRFEFGGRHCLDLTWTLAHRHWNPTERLATDADLRRWFVEAGVLEVSVLPERGSVGPARDLREGIYRCAHEKIAGRSARAEDVTTINQWASKPRLAPVLGQHGTIRWTAKRPIQAALAAVAVDAVLLLADVTGRLRECSREGCALLFVDTSRPGLRRWCSAERCGNAVNTARYRRRSGR
jgi:predicted RNA-binding Zn ribbon-like protein